MQIFYYNTLFGNIEILLNGEHKILDVKKQSEYLVSCIEGVLQSQGLDYKDIDFFSTISGPGNFTSIKTNLAVAKAIKISANKNIICNNLFEIIGFNDKYENIAIKINQNKYYVKSKNTYSILQNIDDLMGKTLTDFSNAKWGQLTEYKIKNNMFNELDAFYLESASITVKKK